MKQPNIVFYFTDQQRWDTLGCYGQELPVTPNLDRIAAEGTLFENAFTCQPVCGPARACLQTGRYPTETGCYTNGIALPFGRFPTLAGCLRGAGYQTAYIGKWHLASQNGDPAGDFRTSAVPPERRAGYAYWMAADVLEFTSHGYNGYMFNGEGRRVDFIGYRPDCINAFAVDFIHRGRDGRPFFLFVSQIDPHHQNDHGRYEGPDGSRARFGGYRAAGDLAGQPGDWAQNYPDYLGQCHSLDENVGRLEDTLREYGLWDNTLLIYTADHGSHFCTRNSEYKRACHDACTHIPLVIHGPGFNRGERVTELVSLMDLPATILDCAGASRPAGWQGDSLRRLVEEHPRDWKEEVFIQISESQTGRAIRTRRWKYSVRAPEGGAIGSPVYREDFLYDLEKDPYERHNLVADPAVRAVRLQLAERLKRCMARAGEDVPEILPHEA